MVVSGVGLMSPESESLISWGANYGPRTTGGEWWRLFTCMFLHAGIIHVGMNMLVLHNIGPFVERLTGNAGQANYAAAKAGIIGFTKSLAREVGSRGITANVVAPGFIDTDMTRALPEAQRQALLADVPLGRLGSAQDIAKAVAFLASPAAGYITGETLHVNGGMYMP